MKHALVITGLALVALHAAAQQPAPSEIVARANAEDWRPIAAADLLVMELQLLANGAPRRVVMQLMPAPFSQAWVGNVRVLARAHWWDGLTVNRVQDNYVVQWGDAHAEDKAKAKPLPPGLATASASAYVAPVPRATTGAANLPGVLAVHDAYAPQVGLTLIGFATQPSPVNLSIIGAPNCFLGVQAAVIQAYVAGGFTHPWALPIPNNVALSGTHLYTQGAALVPGVNAFGLLTSNGVDLLIGTF